MRWPGYTPLALDSWSPTTIFPVAVMAEAENTTIFDDYYTTAKIVRIP